VVRRCTRSVIESANGGGVAQADCDEMGNAATKRARREQSVIHRAATAFLAQMQ
jgi:hypothetical protein